MFVLFVCFNILIITSNSQCNNLETLLLSGVKGIQRYFMIKIKGIIGQTFVLSARDFS